MKITRNKAKILLQEKIKGQIFAVHFIKKNGKLRKMNCRKGVRIGLKGVGLKFDPEEKGLMVVYDLKKNAYRMINLNTIRQINFQKTKFTVSK